MYLNQEFLYQYLYIKSNLLWNILPFYVFPLSFFFLILFFWLQCAAFGILVPRPGIEPMFLAEEAQRLNHCTARGVSLISFFSCLLKGVCSSCLISAIIIQCNMKLPVYRGRESWIQMSLIYLFNVVWLLTRNSAMWKFSFLLCKIRKV